MNETIHHLDNGDFEVVKGVKNQKIMKANINLIGEGYMLPNIKMFTHGFEYERTDGFDWYPQVYDEFKENDVLLLLAQNRLRVKNN